MNNKEKVKASLDKLIPSLEEVSDWMYENPELGFEEYKTSEHLINYMRSNGLEVKTPVGGLDTAFSSSIGSSGPLVVLCVEYDALPEIGHACGHNIIATSSIGAGIALKEIAEDLKIRVKILGTPAEEGGGGKIVLLDEGEFEDASCSMMIHPAPYNVANPTLTTIQQYKVEFFGKDAHAAGAPEEGVNALDAQIQLFVNVSTFRQQLPRTNRMHGVIVDGGFKPNIIPSYTSSEWYLRALNGEDLDVLQKKFMNFVEAAALSTGCTFKTQSPDYRYSEVLNNKVMYDLFIENSKDVGREMLYEDSSLQGLGSTDMGNVSLAMPSIHPMLSIDAGKAVNHQPEFAAATITKGGHKAIFDGAYSMAATIVDLAEKDLWSKL
ncbi:MAG: M20 family metallopeptidase [Actinomycetota bacterium]|nr:M20 family metallopeptidase [Actinomycetota bacterium]